MSQKVMSFEELEKKYPTEEVYAVKKVDFNSIQDGIHKDDVEDILQRFLSEGYFVPRKYAEYNPEHLQIIPYVVIKNKGRYFAAKRIAGDVRVIGKMTIGMGGHINPEDAFEKENSLIVNCINRELSSEELHIDLNKNVSLTLFGTIRYTIPEDLLSQDHVGLLYILETDDDSVSIKESDALEGRYFEVKEIVSNRENSENWSKLIIDLLIK